MSLQEQFVYIGYCNDFGTELTSGNRDFTIPRREGNDNVKKQQ